MKSAFPSFRLACALFLLLWTLGGALRAELEDRGPLAVGFRDVSFVDTHFGRGTITGRIYYPATTNGENAPAHPAVGPFPLVGFQHGYLGRPSNYDELCTQMVSYGLVVASIGTETSLLGEMQPEALDTRSLLHWVDDQSLVPTSFLFTLVDAGTWSAVGHSMGGGALNYLIADEPRVRLIIGLEPYNGPLLGGSAQGLQNVQKFTGRSYYIAGSVDQTVPAEGPRQYFTRATQTQRRVFYYGLGLGHLGPTDDGSNADPLTAAQELDLHKRIVTGTLRAELGGNENLYYDLLGGGSAGQPLQIQTACSHAPILWLAAAEEPTGTTLTVGLAGDPGIPSALASSPQAASLTTPRGELGLAPGTQSFLFRGALPASSIIEEMLPLPMIVPYYFQGVSLGAGGKLSRTQDIGSF